MLGVDRAGSACASTASTAPTSTRSATATAAILYASAGLVALTVTATDRLWETGPGTIVWLALVALACYGVYYVFRASREY